MDNLVLFIGRGIEGSGNTDGGEYGAARVYSMVENSIDSKNLNKLYIKKPNNLCRIKNMFLLQSYGQTKEITKYINNVKSEDVKIAFLNGSIYGSYAKLLHKKGVKVMTFYHNIERNFYYDKVKSTKNILDLLMFFYIWYNEKKVTKYSDYLITLNSRDSNELFRLYNKKADLISPTSYEKVNLVKKEKNINNSYLLFVGGNFFANIDGIKSFIVEVLPKIDMELWVVGNCCTPLNEWLDTEKYPNVKLKGFVDDISVAYNEAAGVVCPIYSGSGMKTKTVEALKYAKYIFATQESFEGIEADYSRIGALCNNSDEFIMAINNWKKTDCSNYNEYSIDVFNNFYSNEIVFKNFKDFLLKKFNQ